MAENQTTILYGRRSGRTLASKWAQRRRLPLCRSDPMSETTKAQEWAQMIRNGARDAGVSRVIARVNQITATGAANRSDVIVACAQILGQNIAAEQTIAAEIRQGIMAMIDGYAMRVATNAA